MSVVPPAIPDVGATTQRLAQNPRFDPMKAGFGTEEYYVWSRFDGATSLKDLILMTGLPTERVIEIVRGLWQRGAILAPGDDAGAALARGTGSRPVAAPPVRAATVGASPPPVRAATVSASPPPPPAPGPVAAAGPRSRSSSQPPPTSGGAPIPELHDPTPDELAALAEPGAMSDAERRRVLVGLRLIATGDPWALLGLPRGADRRTLKRAFFERSKLFHPDRFYGREIGVYRERLHVVFEAISRAHTELTDDSAGRRRSGSTPATAPQSPAEYAAELFDRACVAEVSGDAAQALKLFAAAVKLDGQARYLRRAAVCALGAGELQAALDYAKKAAALEGSDPSTARILGQVLRRLGRLDEAEEVLVMALAMKSENDVLQRELVADLRAVRADLAR